MDVPLMARFFTLESIIVTLRSCSGARTRRNDQPTVMCVSREHHARPALRVVSGAGVDLFRSLTVSDPVFPLPSIVYTIPSHALLITCPLRSISSQSIAVYFFAPASVFFLVSLLSFSLSLSPPAAIIARLLAPLVVFYQALALPTRIRSAIPARSVATLVRLLPSS